MTKVTDTVDNATIALREAEHALEHALERERAIMDSERQRLAELAHEIRTPLNAMIGYAHMLAEAVNGPHSDEGYHDYSQTVYHASLHLQDICNGILEELEPGKTNTVDVCDVDVGELIDGVVNLFSGMAKERGVELGANVDVVFPTLKTDPRRLNQIIINLVSNAVKFTPRGGNVSVEAAYNDASGAMIFVISDTGQGMPAEKLRKSIGTYSQIPGTSPHGDQGSGLGLSISQRLATQLHGELLVASEENIGTVAAVQLPIDFNNSDQKYAKVAASDFVPNISSISSLPGYSRQP